MAIIIPEKVNPLILSYPDFVFGAIINPDEFDQNNLDIQDKLNEFIDVVNTTIDNTVEVVVIATEALNNSITATNTANLALTQSNLAVSTANSAVTTANSAVTTANTASTNATTALNKATQVETDYNLIKPELEQAVSDAEAAVDAVAGKADVAYVDAVAAGFVLGALPNKSVTGIKIVDGTLTEELLHPDVIDKINDSIQDIIDLDDRISDLETDVGLLQEKTGALTMERFNKDDNDIYTEIHYKRADSSLYKTSILSGGTSPQYTTRTETFYAPDGVTVIDTQVYTLNYTGEDLTSEVLT